MPPANQDPATPPQSGQPVGLTPQPVMYDTPGAPQNAAPLPPATAPLPPAMGEPKRGGALKWAIIAVVAVIVVGGVVGLLMHNKTNKNGTGGSGASSHQAAESSQLNLLSSKAAGLNAATLNSFNATDLFFAVYRHAAEQPAVTSTLRYYQTANLNDQPPSTKLDLRQTGYNYHTQQLTFQDSTVYGSGSDDEYDRCINGAAYSYSSLFPEDGWKRESGPAVDDNCHASSNIYINDQLNTGGLTASQAQKFVDALRSYQGLITVDKLSLATFQGKSYLRFDVTAHQIDNGGVHDGVAFFAKAFDATGLDSTKWPYNLGGALISGIHMAYFVDPSTQLPAYSQIAYTPPTPSSPWDNDQVVYSFGALPTVDLSTSNVQPLSISWPTATLQ